MRFWFILILLFILSLAFLGIPGEFLTSKEMIKSYFYIGIVCYLIKKNFFIKDIVKEIKEITNEE